MFAFCENCHWAIFSKNSESEKKILAFFGNILQFLKHGTFFKPKIKISKILRDFKIAGF